MKILISDTHFGCRQNSMTWLDSQMSFFYNQLIPFIKKHNRHEKISLYHLGDVFDVRSTVNLLVADKVHRLFEDLINECHVVKIIGGNHDYYSPNENEDNVNSLRTVLGDLEEYNGFHIIDRDFEEDVDEKELFIPWFRYFDFDEIKQQLKYPFNKIYVHSDLTVTFEDRYRELFKDCQVYSGHIHTPKHNGNLHTLGSTFALTFADANSERGFYTMNDDGSNLLFHPNTESIKFYRLYNKEIFGSYNFKKEDYVELYVDQGNLLKDSYIESIKKIAKNVNNFVTIPRSDVHLTDDSTDFEKYDIADICRQNIPENLLEKFNKISFNTEMVEE